MVDSSGYIGIHITAPAIYSNHIFAIHGMCAQFTLWPYLFWFINGNNVKQTLHLVVLLTLYAKILDLYAHLA